MDKNQYKKHLNIVVVGRSGVGKSSFLNYVAGKQVFETGNGDPKTQKYFEANGVELSDKNVQFCLFDTKGLEAGNTKDWESIVFQEIDRRDKSENIYDWFHTVLYCIDASSKRIQEYEIQCIKELMQHSSVVILLTKKDRATPSDLENLKRTILEELGNKIQIKAVCSVESRNRKGEVSKPEGLEQVLRVCFLGMWEKVAKVYPLKLLRSIDIVYTDLNVPYTNDGFFALITLIEGQRAPEYIRKWKAREYFGSRKVIPSEFDYYCDDNSNKILNYTRKAEDVFKFTLKSQASKVLRLPTSVVVEEDLVGHSLRYYIRCIVRIFKQLIENFKECNLRKHIDSSRQQNIINELLNFYNQVNEDNKSILMFNDTFEAVRKIEEYDYSSLEKQLDEKATEIDLKLLAVEDCLFSATDERNKAILAYLDFRDFIKYIKIELWIL